MTKVCAYVMKVDSGLAPNPFHGICTLAVCTPNHMRCDLEQGDWIIGLAGADIREALGNRDRWRLVHAMHLEKRLTLDAYYRDSRFQCKIPKRHGTQAELRGDNFYRLESGVLIHTGETEDHVGEPLDAEGNRVYISRRFWYFGSKAPALPNTSWAHKIPRALGPVPQGVRYIVGGRGLTWTSDEFAAFQQWLDAQPAPSEPVPLHFYGHVGPPDATAAQDPPARTITNAVQANRSGPSCS